MRFLFYSADSYGLGHVNRTLNLAGTLLQGFPRASALLVTGAPRAHYFDYPSRCDYLKLPSVTKDAGGAYVSRDLDMSLQETVRLRSRLIQDAAESFRAEVLLVDHAPLGMCGEILTTLQHLGPDAAGNRRTLRVLGLRDVIDEPEAVRASWRTDGAIEALRHCYDRILVYGQQSFFDPIRAYDIPADVARKVTFVGYIPRTAGPVDVSSLRRRYAPRTGRLVLVILGGGGDGNVLLRNVLEGYSTLGTRPPFEILAITGPLMSPRKRERFAQQASELPGVSLEEYSHDLPALMRAASFVVSMGGYNSVCELACAGARALIVPRTFPRKEQLLRARVLEARGVARCLPPDEATPELLIDEITRGLDSTAPAPGWGLEFTGLERTADVMKLLLSDPPTYAEGASREVSL
jgi:predicted glycosyltransferase